MEESEKKSKRKLRKYQKDYVKNCFNLLISLLLCLLVAPTGAGKTFMFYSIARKLLKKKKKDNKDKNATINIVILSPRLSINAQTVSENNINILSKKSDFIKINGTDYEESCDKYKDKIKDKNINFIISSTYHSAHKLQEFIEKNKIEIDLMIFDECHFIKSWDFNQDTKSLKARTFIMEDKTYIKKRLFCSATPYKEQRENEKLYGKVIEEVKVGELIKAGYLSPIKTIIKDFKGKCSLSKLIIKEIIDKNKQKSVVFCNTQENCKTIHSQLLKDTKETDIKPYLFISDKNVIDDLQGFEKEGEISVIITCKRISMGYDYPLIDMIVFADAKCEKVEIAQCIGRGLRIIPDNPDKICHVLLPVDEENIDSSDYKTIVSYFKYMREECDYEILASEFWVPNTPLSPSKPKPPKDYGFNTEIEFTNEEIRTKIIDKYCVDSLSKYTDFKRFLKQKNISNEVEYNELVSCNNFNIPIIDSIRDKYEEFCFKDIINNSEDYYQTKEEAEEAITKAKIQFKILKSNKKKKFKNSKLLIELNGIDSKIPLIDLNLYYLK